MKLHTLTTLFAILLATASLAHAGVPPPLDCKSPRLADATLTVAQAEQNLKAAHSKEAEADALLAYAELKYVAREPTFSAALSTQANAIWHAAPATAELALRLQHRAQELRAMNNCALAAPLLRTAIAVSENASGADHAQTADILADLVIIEIAQDDTAALSRDGARLVQAWASHGDPADDIASPVYRKLIDLYYRQQQYAQAEPLALRNLRNGEQVHDKQAPALIERLDDLAAIYYGQLRFAEAEALSQRGDRLAVKDNPNTFRVTKSRQRQVEGEMRQLFNAGKVSGALARGEQELKLLEKTVSDDATALQTAIKAREAAGPGSPQIDTLSAAATRASKQAESSESDLAAMRVRVAELYHHQRRYDQAEALYQQALLNYTQAQSEPLAVAPAKSSLATLYRARADYERALPLQQQALATLLAAYGADHPDVIDCARELALLYQHQGKTAEMATLSAQVPALQRR
jgi:tetratricopeptide (TPR) repeat protein